MRFRSGAVAAIPALILAAAAVARAAPSRIVEGEAILDGEHTFGEVIVKPGATLRVRPRVTYDSGAVGLGSLHLKAGRIVIEAGGAIDATGAGYQGADALDGAQPDATSGAGRRPAIAGRPGSGGANGGDGALGLSPACGSYAETAFGVAYTDALALLLPGSAGGAANHLDASFPSRGGHGGGAIVLEAAEIEILGEVLARGGDGISVKGLGSGGGAGGAVRILAAALEGDGTISAAGGKGGDATQRGGGGGGGVVVITTAGGVVPAGLAIDVAGGASGACAGAAGGDGLTETTAGEACLDVDGDGHLAASCAGGDDCDDGDAGMHPGAGDDTCDGLDNDCSGAADDAVTPAACPDLHTCQAGQCVPLPDAGTPPDGGQPAGPPPDRLEVQGGCALGGAPAGGAAALAGLGLLGALARRGRARRVVTRGKLS